MQAPPAQTLTIRPTLLLLWWLVFSLILPTAAAANVASVPQPVVIAYAKMQLTPAQRQEFDPVITQAVDKINAMRKKELQRREFVNERRIRNKCKRAFAVYKTKLAGMLTAQQQAPFETYANLVLTTLTSSRQTAGYNISDQDLNSLNANKRTQRTVTPKQEVKDTK